MYKIYWNSVFGLLFKRVEESDVKQFIDALDRLGIPVDKIEME